MYELPQELIQQQSQILEFLVQVKFEARMSHYGVYVGINMVSWVLEQLECFSFLLFCAF